MDNNHRPIYNDDDDILMPFADLVQELVAYNGYLEDPASGHAMTIERVKLNMPVEIRVTVDDDGTIRLKGSPPTQLTETTIMPVFHQLQMEVMRDDDI